MIKIHIPVGISPQSAFHGIRLEIIFDQNQQDRSKVLTTSADNHFSQNIPGGLK